MRISDWSSDVCSSDLPLDIGDERKPIIRPLFCSHVDDSAPAVRIILGRGRGNQFDVFNLLCRKLAKECGGIGLYGFPVDQQKESLGTPHGDLALTVYRNRRHRSEERREGKECVRTFRARWSPSHSKKKK